MQQGGSLPSATKEGVSSSVQALHDLQKHLLAVGSRYRERGLLFSAGLCHSREAVVTRFGALTVSDTSRTGLDAAQARYSSSFASRAAAKSGVMFPRFCESSVEGEFCLGAERLVLAARSVVRPQLTSASASELPFNAAAPTTSGKKSWPQKPGRFSSPCAVSLAWSAGPLPRQLRPSCPILEVNLL